MHPQTLYPKTKQVLIDIAKLQLPGKFYLAGGTALALQLGHRKSIDLDLFSAEFPKRDILLQNLRSLNPTISAEAEGTLDTLIDEVKVSFLEYTYPLLEDLTEFEGLNIASVKDIACMKLTAISSRGSKKDFIDFYNILQTTDLATLFTSFEKKFEGVSYQKLHILKSLTYFEDAEKDPDPDYIEKFDWEEVKRFLEKTTTEYLK